MPFANRFVRAGTRSFFWPLRLALLILACFFSNAAFAQDPSGEADALFKSGLEQMRAGHYEAACPMLAKSYQIDPLPGALFTEADCEAAWGKVATAIEHYQAFVSALTALPADRRAKFDERRRLALEKIGALGPLACELTIDVALASPESLVVKRNGVVINRAAYGVSKKVDPGEYAVIAEVDGRIAWERDVTLGQGDRARIDVPWLESPKTPPAAAVVQEPVIVAPPSRPRAAPTSSSTGRTLAYFAGGIGIGGLAAGIITGVLAVEEKGVIDDNCPHRLCNATGHDAVESARAAAMVSTIGFSVGLAGAASATVLWLTSSPDKKTDESRAAVRPIVVATGRGAALGLGGTFP
jgi:hypothetical protein